MYAIFANGNKQYKAAVGETVKLEKLNAEVGSSVEFPVVITADEKGIQAGKEVESLKVTCEVLSHGKDKKIIVFKYKAKKNERKKQGHRQPYSLVKVTAIGATAVKETATKKAAPKKTAAKKTAEAKVEETVSAAE